MFVLYCYGGKEYFDSSIKVLFDIFPLLMGDEHEIYIYIYMYIIFEEMFEVKILVRVIILLRSNGATEQKT